MQKTVYIVAGANGSGKTTFAREFLKKEKIDFLNADEIAKELSPANMESASVPAAKILLNQLRDGIAENKSFLLETTLSGLAYIRTIDELHSKGYSVHLFYFFLDNPEASIERIKVRVKEGGHHVADEDVKRRCQRSLFNFWNKYKDKVDCWILSYNGGEKQVPVAVSKFNAMTVLDKVLFESFKQKCEARKEFPNVIKKTHTRIIPVNFSEREKE